MHENEVLKRAFAMPLTSPAYPPGPYRFVNREYLIITYRTDPAKLRSSFRLRSKSTNARRSSNTNSSVCRIQTVLATTRKAARSSRYRSAVAGAATPTACSSTMRDRSPAAGSSGAFRKSSASRRCEPRSTPSSALSITVRCGSQPARWDTSTAKPTCAQVKAALEEPNFLLKIIPHVDGSPRICELVEYHLEEVV